MGMLGLDPEFLGPLEKRFPRSVTIIRPMHRHIEEMHPSLVGVVKPTHHGATIDTLDHHGDPVQRLVARMKDMPAHGVP